jgi:hypothetical protein
MNNPEELNVLQHFADALDNLGIDYAIGGSIASSIYGAVRFTEDADVTVEPFEDCAEQLYNSLQPDYYISKSAMYDALSNRGSFNVINLASAFKIDVFVRKETSYQKQITSRVRALKLSESLEKKFNVLSPEDVILMKLSWFLEGDGASQRQLQDVKGVLIVQSGKLDLKYMKKWAARLNLTALLEEAITKTNDSN